MGDVLVSIVVPIRNEIAHVGQMLDTLFNQDCPSFEVIVVDGMSDDGTYEYLIEQSDNRENLRVLRNADKVTPRALNIGILASKGDYIAILGAHCLYENSYLNTCVKFLEKENGYGGCGGIVETIAGSQNVVSEAIKDVMSSKYAVSSGSFRVGNIGEVESIAYPIFRKAVFDKVGLYNESLIRNQDNDMNSRIVKSGFKLFITDQVKCFYFCPVSVKALLRYAFRGGKWNGITLKLNVKALDLRHFIPLAFVIYLLLYMVFFTGNFLAEIPILFYFCLTILIVTRIEKFSLIKLLLIPCLTFFLHFAYGIGTLFGILIHER